VVAAENAEMPTGMRKSAFFNVLHPGSKHTDRNLVLLLAGYGTGVTTDAAILVDDKAITHKSQMRMVTEEHLHATAAYSA